MSKALSVQLFRFGIVGLGAAALHYCVVVALVQNKLAAPLIANVLGFGCGFQISYWGHRTWTFEAGKSAHLSALTKMLIIQSLNFMANESLFYLLLSLGIPYMVALLIVLSVLPIFTFFASKLWVFSR